MKKGMTEEQKAALDQLIAAAGMWFATVLALGTGAAEFNEETEQEVEQRSENLSTAAVELFEMVED